MHSSDRSNRPLSEAEKARRAAQSERDKGRQELLTRNDIQNEYRFSKRWLELAALNGNGPPMVKISSRMVRYQRGAWEDWLAARTVGNTSEQFQAA
jgi:hypothetical protein